MYLLYVEAGSKGAWGELPINNHVFGAEYAEGEILK